MYDRDYAGKTLNFEPSGGLMHSSLVMQDKETDTYWSIMSGKAEGGDLKDTQLKELPVSEKMQWKDWVAAHPDTLVLSITSTGRDGIERTFQDLNQNAYGGYFADPGGFRGASAADTRLRTKDPIYAFMEDEVKYAIPAASLVGGKVFELKNGVKIFLYRAADDQMFRGTAAYRTSSGFEMDGGAWIETSSGARFDPGSREFSPEVERLNGFDTFWYNWSLMNPQTELLR